VDPGFEAGAGEVNSLVQVDANYHQSAPHCAKVSSRFIAPIGVESNLHDLDVASICLITLRFAFAA
jgi:hypothetical protein